MEDVAARKVWRQESYVVQSRLHWPGRGKYILAQYDDEGIVVYQAFRKEIADYAVEHQKFIGCELYGEARMTWIKTNFMWMMYRSKWGSRPNQDHILAIWLKREAFEAYLENARRRGSTRQFTGTVRLQWDPDHDPRLGARGDKHPYRRAVQLGLRGVPSFANGEDILHIEDISTFVREQGERIAKRYRKGCDDELHVARERVYVPLSVVAREALSLDKYDV